MTAGRAGLLRVDPGGGSSDGNDRSRPGAGHAIPGGHCASDARQDVVVAGSRGAVDQSSNAASLRVGYQKYGVRGLQDKRRVDRPNGVPESEIKRWLQLYEQRYRGYNVRHFYAVMKRNHGGCRWSYTVVRRTLQAAGLVKKKHPRGRHFIRREPRPCCGEMLHIDGISPEDGNVTTCFSTALVIIQCRHAGAS